VAVIRIPPLRERDHDAVLIARALLEETSRRYKLPVRALSPDAEVALRGYAWPGNVRELANTMERIVLFSDADPVRAEDLGLPNGAPAGSSVSVQASGGIRVDFRTPACPSRPWSARSSSRRWRRPAATRARPPGCSASRATRSATGSQSLVWENERVTYRLRIGVVGLVLVAAAPAALLASGTSPALVLSAAIGSAAGSQRAVTLDGSLDFANAVQVAYPLSLVVFQGSRFVRYRLPGAVVAGTSPSWPTAT